jgi:hypothetical protein
LIAAGRLRPAATAHGDALQQQQQQQPQPQQEQQQLTTPQASLKLLHELLRHDYAIGYLLLSWLLQSTWTIAPAVADLIGLPRPDAQSKVHLPALLAWLLGSKQVDQQQQVLAQLTPQQLQQIQEHLSGPAAALSSFACFVSAQQATAGAPITIQQVNNTMRSRMNLLNSRHACVAVHITPTSLSVCSASVVY